MNILLITIGGFILLAFIVAVVITMVADIGWQGAVIVLSATGILVGAAMAFSIGLERLLQ